jgi:Cysteine-rich CPXCG
MTPKGRSSTRSDDPIDPQSVDELYGLEPVFEPGSASDEPTPVARVQCPWCGECFDTVADISAGSFQYIEDCEICCQPIELDGTVDDDGALAAVAAKRA